MTGLGFAGIEYMQEMDQVTCYRAADGEKGRLEDIRDGKVYWVGKLKDGNCWMTQNLDLDLYANGANRKLTSADSDMSSDWTSTTGASGLWVGSSSDYNVVKYYDPGEYAYTNPTNRLSSGCGTLDSTACANAGWKLMSGASTNDSGSETTHYLAGNYYSWGAATAGQAASLTSTTAGEQSTQSICPKGWRLPLSKNSNNAISGSFYNLLSKYGLQNSLTVNSYDIRLAPLYFVYGGYVNSSSLDYAGSYGRYWSSTAVNASYAYNLVFYTSVSPSNDISRYFGFSVRCVAR